MIKKILQFILILLLVTVFGIAIKVGLADLYYSDSFLDMKREKDDLIMSLGTVKPYDKSDETIALFLQAVADKNLEPVVVPEDYKNDKFRQFEKFFYDERTKLLPGDWVASSGDLKAYSMKIEMGERIFRPIYFFQKVGSKYLYRPLNDFNAYSYFVTQMQHKEELKTLSYMDKVKVLLSPNMYSFNLSDGSNIFFKKAENHDGHLFSIKMAGKKISVLDKNNLPDYIEKPGYIYLNQNENFALEYRENGEVIDTTSFAFTETFLILPHFSSKYKYKEPSTSLESFFSLWFILSIFSISIILLLLVNFLKRK